MNGALVLAMLSVWGYVVFVLIGNAEKPTVAAEQVRHGKALTDTNSAGYSYEATFDYADPFLKGRYKAQQSKQELDPKPPSIPKPKEVKVMEKWPVVQYMGMVHSHERKKSLALVNVDGRSYLIKSDTAVGQLRFSTYNPDSLVAIFHGRMQSFHRQ